jgi:class 3 adenylate cyclase
MDKKFEELLLKYARSSLPEEREQVEAQLWSEFGQTKAIFIMDMSGFSLLTQKYGIVHYLSMVKRMQVTTRPIIEQMGGEVVKFEADNCFAMFDSVKSAVEAAIVLNRTFNAMNEFTDDTFDIRVSIGIDFGNVLLVGGPDYFGGPVNRASKLGEDIAGPGEIYITETAFNQIPPEAGFSGERLELDISGIRLPSYILSYSLA